jgi:aminopeptidase
MEELYRKYAEVLLDTCLRLKKHQPLYISYNKEIKYFIDIVLEEAMKYEVDDIYLEENDVDLKHDLLKEKDIEYLKTTPYWNREARNDYTKKKAAFLLIVSEVPGIMEDIDVKKIIAINNYSMTTRKEFDDARSKSELAWCICAVPTLRWAETLYPNEDKPLDKLWDKMLDICLIKNENPKKTWNDYLINISKGKFGIYITVCFIILTLIAIGSQMLS